MDATYDVHFQEWIEDWELTKDTDYVEISYKDSSNEAYGTSGGTPFGHIVPAKWKKAYKYNYSDRDVGKTQIYGEAY